MRTACCLPFNFRSPRSTSFSLRRQAIAEIGREQNLLIEFFHHRFEAENGIHHVADDGRVALRIEPDIAAGDRAKMERDPDLKRLSVGPLDRRPRAREYRVRS